jgi:REP element-mobilizing transposase RayT
MININEAWDIVFTSATKAKRLRVVFKSVREHMPYEIGELNSNKIEILVSKSEPKSFGRQALQNQLQRLNSKNGKLSYHDFFDNVAKETAVVFLHPKLSWDESGQYIVEIKN